MKENPLTKYGVTEPVHRPRIKPVKQLDLDTAEGKLIVLSEAKRIMQILIRTNTFGHFAKRVQSLNEVNNVNKENPQNTYR